MAKRIIKPNVVSGGVAIPLGNNFYYMKGRKHKNGGIDIGSNPKTGIEVEDGEVMQMMQNGAKVFSSMPFLRGSSPANKVLAGENPDNVFRQQELYKNRNNINDDGTKKKAAGGQIPPYNTNNKSNMYSRMKDSNRKTIKDWKTGKVATHKLSYATVDDKTIVYPNIQEINGELYDFTDPKNNRGKWDSLRRAIDTGDTLQFNNEADADKFVNNYKKKFKGFDKYAGGGQIPPWKKQQNNTQPYSPTLNLNENQLYELQKGVLGENKANLKKTINDTKIIDKNKPARKITDNQYNSRKNIIKDYNDQHEKEAYRSKKDMPFDYKVDNRDKKQVKWIADWYNGRRKQIYNNLYNYAQGYLDDVYMYRYNKNNNNFTREKDYFNRFMNKKNAIDKEYDRLLNNMSSANIDNSLLDDASYDVLGGYEPPFKAHKKNKYYGHTVGYRPDATKDVIVHERTHAANPNAQINAVNTIKSIDNKDYIKSAKEVYSRLMQYRYKHNLNPKTKIDDSYLNSHRKELYDLDLDFMSDEELKFLFNEVADNNKTNKIKPIAKFGGYKKYAGGGIARRNINKYVPDTKIDNPFRLAMYEVFGNTPMYDKYISKINYPLYKSNNIKQEPVVETPPKTSNKFFNFFKNKDNLSDTIGIGSNILGSTLSYFANRRMLNNMKAPIKHKIPAPVSYQATKLKTNVNINPQLDTLRNSSAIYNNSVDNNTSSSRVALARKQANRLNINNQINALYGNKENQETELINRDRLQQQQTANQNIAQYNDYLTRKTAIDNEYNNQLINFNNTINEKKGENLVSLFNNSNAAIQDILNRREQRNNERNTIAAYLASNPNVNPRLFTRLGIDGVFTDEMIELWDKYQKNKLKTN